MRSWPTRLHRARVTPREAFVNDARWRRIQELFLEARERAADARDAHLRAACPNDAELRGEVQRMLAADAGEGILDRPAPVLPLAELAADAHADSPMQERV